MHHKLYSLYKLVQVNYFHIKNLRKTKNLFWPEQFIVNGKLSSQNDVHNIMCIFLSDSPEDFNIISPIAASSSLVELFLGPTVSRSCFTINTIDDAVPERPGKVYQFVLPSLLEGPSTFQVLRTSSISSVTILDDDCEFILIE